MMGVNTRNMDPAKLLGLVTRNITYDIVTTLLRSKDTAHPEDKATY